MNALHKILHDGGRSDRVCVANIANDIVAAARSSQLLDYASYDAGELIQRALRVMSQPLALSVAKIGLRGKSMEATSSQYSKNAASLLTP